MAMATPMTQTATRLSGNLTAPAGAFFGGLIAVDIVLLFAVSGYLLIEAGWNYGDAGGSAPEKIHPATLLAGFLLLSAMLPVFIPTLQRALEGSLQMMLR